jgi:hypothetical protein
MQIRIPSTGQVMYEGEFRALHPHTSLPQQLTESIINSLGGEVVFEGPQASPTRYQTAFADGVHQVNGKWFTKYSVADMDAEAIAAKDAKQAESVRDDRNKRLAETDWTQLSDAPVNSSAWGTYRQNLRNITEQSGFPWEITWPTKPISE